ncbi:flagellar hook-length control protein FliK [Methylomonas methanica]|uniref:Flagellar hook-length control protein n=1 Tax=Methylomonas methanica (strain DSM 25384 / MC09) TaxID=857087 RepID=G0A1U8_METMM|nr:flagellar hook-length control protein FliK [Methylomonas methanica]AEG01331.1 flagellar hook-length control protein [Methylomonas methanica MC09]
MNIQAANLLSMLTGSEGLGNIQQGLLGGTGDNGGFASALMEQLGLLQSGASPDMSAIQSLMDDAGVKGDLQNFAAFFGKNLPVASKSAGDIDLEDTLKTLAEVLQQLQQLEADPNSVGSPAIATTEQTIPPTDLQQEALDQEALANNPPPMPISVPAEVSDDAEPVAGDADIAGMLADVKKPAPLSVQDTKTQNATDAVAGKPDELGVEFDRSISAMMSKQGESGQSQQEKPALDLKTDPKLGQLENAPDNQEVKASPTAVAGDIARMNATVRSESTAPLPSNQPAMQKPFGDSAWNQELGDKLIWMHKQDMPSVQLRLNPEHLGPIVVKIDVNHDQATVAFTAQHMAVKDAIEAAIPKLREMLGGQQLNLVDVNVSQQQADQRQSSREFFQMAGGQNQRGGADGDLLTNGVVNESQDIVDEIEAGRAIATNGLLSLFA